jgi:hypothetical protein
MKHLKKFENFDLGHRFSEEDEDLQIQKLGFDEEEGEECKPCSGSEEEEGLEGSEESEYTFSSEEEDEEEEEVKNWNDEEELRLEKVISFRQFEAKKTKPDFLDLDKDGDKKESMKKAAEDAKSKKDDKKDSKDDKKEDKKEEKGGKGLTAAQKKLPEGLRKAIEAKKKK